MKYLILLFTALFSLNVQAQLSKVAADAAVYIPDRGVYIFSGKQYYKYEPDLTSKTTPKLMTGYPKDLPGGWQGLPEFFYGGIDAAFYYPPTKKTYLFKGGQYLRMTDIKVDPGYPKKLPGGFQGLPLIFQRDIDAAFTVTSATGGKSQVVLVKNEDYIVFEEWKKVEQGKLKNLWKGLPGGFNEEIQAVCHGGFWGNYLFAGDKVIFAPGHAAQKNPFFNVNMGTATFKEPKNISEWNLSLRQVSPFSIASLCPEGNMCPDLVQLLFDVRIRSYVPPRFSHFGSKEMGPRASIENMVSHHNYKNLTKVGCRYSVSKVNRQILDDMDLFEQFADLFNQTRNQWQGIYDDAKGLAADVVAEGVCGIVDPSESCKEDVSSVVETGINIGLAAIGVPPTIPDLEQLREHGIEYMATQAAGYAVGGADQLVGEVLSPLARAAAYEASYRLAKDEFKKQLDKTIPLPTYDGEDPSTWGTLLPMYTPHNAHMYLEITVKNRKAYEIILGENFTAYPTLQIKDSRDVYRDLLKIPFPEYIPEEGLIIPLELRPAEHLVLPPTGEYNVDAQYSLVTIPGEKISMRYLQEKFFIYDLYKQQKNFLSEWSNIHFYPYSDWDLFYSLGGTGKIYKDAETTFELKGNFSFKDGSTHYPRYHTFESKNIAVVDVWDAVTGEGVLRETTSRSTHYRDKKYVLNEYYGRQDPPCSCGQMKSDPCEPKDGNIIFMSWWK